ncbi:NAD(P)-dependent oxidoreductase [Paenibacillus silvae]|uniref:NAD(P)-dependent oxidoreductase n=1 Tax=Paenibacillus silvae TaxID=1325358 RepID=UPI0020040E08|nr:NAD(P)-dependent oxidoreductase [Paenibacillus silvae]MCK6076255.1 NAD(P)-dependent oxidoreductase [Paenibacillus silvae]MCK6150586.1 NAD(P)-dependent oxidoreductase [Paenibacillus silvae]MCK6268846.1 NAD(P)-dependent oxidoreductase [Paenibacillus silvae]MCK6270439.1 NAD(P)-dependent oxidoreductase [Paenibacillus silvae]
MKIAVIGATGKAGSIILKEAADRGHEVTAIVRDASKLQDKSLNVLEKDVFDLTASDVQGFDVVVNAFGAPAGKENLHVEVGQALINLLKEAPNTRLIVVGGAGSLFTDESKTMRLVDSPGFPDAYKATASNQGQNLKDLQASSGIQWTFLSPAAFFNPEGVRTGQYKAGQDVLIVNSEGNSYISYADYAIALVDEIEKPQHQNQRFTVVGEAK